MWASAGYLGLPSFTAKYVCQCLWRVRVGSFYWWRPALSVSVAPLLETLDFKDRSEPLMRQLASRVDVPDQPRLHDSCVVVGAEAHLQLIIVGIDIALKHRPGATNNAPAFLQLPVFLHVLYGCKLSVVHQYASAGIPTDEVL